MIFAKFGANWRIRRRSIRGGVTVGSGDEGADTAVWRDVNGAE